MKRLTCCLFLFLVGIVVMNGFLFDSQAHKLPIVSGHRGASGLAPENTLAAVRKAMQLGATMTEIDVHLTKDGRVVLMHDDSLHRTTDGNGLVVEKTLEEIKTLDAGSWFDKAYAPEPVPTLDEVMDLVRDKMKLNIEIKISGLEPDIAERTIAVIRDNEFSDQCMITSFDRSTIEKVKVLAPDIRTGWIFSKIPGAEVFGGTWEVLSVNYKSIDAEFMEKARAANKQVYVWTVNKPGIMTKMIEFNVNAILTDYPDRLIEILNHL